MGRTCCVNGHRMLELHGKWESVLPISIDLGPWVFYGFPYPGPLGLARLGTMESRSSPEAP